jgi:glycosyltransferase involved in cell wall biosynthesis
MKPKISVITVTYNAQAFMERTIKSVIGQTYTNIEYVIIDGKSKDGTLDIVKQYENHIDILVSEPDKGLYDAMNKGIRYATGDYILFMNAGDCFAAADTLEKAMQGSNNADLVYGLALRIDEATGAERTWHKKAPPPQKLSYKSFIAGMVICHQCFVVKRTCAEMYDLSTWKIANDIDWSIRTMKNVKTKHFYNATFCHFLEGGVSDERRWKAFRERLDILRKHFGLLPTLWQQFIVAFQVIGRGRID